MEETMKQDNCKRCPSKETGCCFPVKNTLESPCPCTDCRQVEICRDSCEKFLDYIGD